MTGDAGDGSIWMIRGTTAPKTRTLISLKRSCGSDLVPTVTNHKQEWKHRGSLCTSCHDLGHLVTLSQESRPKASGLITGLPLG